MIRHYRSSLEFTFISGFVIFLRTLRTGGGLVRGSDQKSVFLMLGYNRTVAPLTPDYVCIMVTLALSFAWRMPERTQGTGFCVNRALRFD